MTTWPNLRNPGSGLIHAPMTGYMGHPLCGVKAPYSSLRATSDAVTCIRCLKNLATVRP